MLFFDDCRAAAAGGRQDDERPDSACTYPGQRSLALARCGISPTPSRTPTSLREPRWAKAHGGVQALKGFSGIEALEALKVSHESVGPQDDEGSAKGGRRSKEIAGCGVPRREDRRVDRGRPSEAARPQDHRGQGGGRTDEEKVEACFDTRSQQQSGT